MSENIMFCTKLKIPTQKEYSKFHYFKIFISPDYREA